ncbi:hypothetical protein COK43_20300 [Bacillus cereus]|nr:hypothetical protein COK43_20300 [Bacillus cereus]
MEILLSELEEYSDYKQKITDLINNQTLTSSDTALNLLNESIRQQQERYIIEGNIEELLTLINNRWISLDKIKSFANYCFQIGKFEDCYKSLLTLKELSEYYDHHEIEKFCKENLRIFYSYGYEKSLPEPSNKHYHQSQENTDETYPDLEKVYEAINTNTVNSLLESLYEEIEKAPNERRAAALFALGELHLSNQNMQETIEFYIQAIKENPNKALYWGYTAQVMNRNKLHPLISIRFLQNAIELDPLNPRWHFLQSLILLEISNQEEIGELINQAVYEAQYALELCRPDQVGLRKAILILLGQE